MKSCDQQVIISLLKVFFIILLFALCLCSCTLSFQNICIHGTASDVVDSEPKTDADLDVKLPTI